MTAINTRDRIIDTAEQLFADQGYAGTSIRGIVAAAGVNLAAIHYHFGSKDELLLAILDRYALPVNQRRLELLQQVVDKSGNDPPSVEGILEAFIAPSFHLIRDLGERGATRARFLGRIYTSPDETVQSTVRAQFKELGERFLPVLGLALPDIPPQEIYWRMKFVLSIMTTIMAESPQANAFPEFRDPSNVDGMIRNIVAFCTPGLRAPVLKEQISMTDSTLTN